MTAVCINDHNAAVAVARANRNNRNDFDDGYQRMATAMILVVMLMATVRHQ